MILEPGLVILVTMAAVVAFIVIALPGIVKGGNSTITVDPNTTTIRLIECPYSKLGQFENENLQGCSFTYNKMDEGMFKCRLSGGGKLEVRTVKNEYTNEKKLMYLRLIGLVIVTFRRANCQGNRGREQGRHLAKLTSERQQQPTPKQRLAVIPLLASKPQNSQLIWGQQLVRLSRLVLLNPPPRPMLRKLRAVLLLLVCMEQI